MAGQRETSVIGVIPQYPKHSQHNIFAKIRMPPVGIVSVLSQLSNGYKAYAIDENNYSGPRDFRGLPDHTFLQNRNPSKIAMFYGGMSNSVPRLFSLAKQYQNWGILTISGGSHVDALPEEALNSGVDVVVHGEGEETAQDILDAVIKDGEIRSDFRKKLEDIEGISFLDSTGKFRHGERRLVSGIENLEDMDLTLIKYIKKRWSAIPVMRGRGCNFRCDFCTVSDMYGKYKKSSDETTLEQIVKGSDRGYTYFFINDDNFTQDPASTIELCKKIGDYKRKFKKKFEIAVQVRSEIAKNDSLIEAMKYAGVKMLCIGYESPIDEELKSMKKGVTVAKLVESSRKLADHFYLHGMFIFGYPIFKDSKNKSDLSLEEKMKAYERFFKKARIDTLQVLNAIPLPGTKLRSKLEKEGRIFPLEAVGWDKYDGLFLCYDPAPEGLDAYDLQNFPRLLMKRRYLGHPINKGVNYGNWMNWACNATVGFPVQFGLFYTKRFLHNLVERRREHSITKEELLPKRNIFINSLVSAWHDIERKWRNLAIKTYGGGITRRWLKEYKGSNHASILEDLTKH